MTSFALKVIACITMFIDHLSYGLYGRSANCGDCLQPCRKSWTLTFEESQNDAVSNKSLPVCTAINKLLPEKQKSIKLP